MDEYSASAKLQRQVPLHQLQSQGPLHQIQHHGAAAPGSILRIATATTTTTHHYHYHCCHYPKTWSKT